MTATAVKEHQTTADFSGWATKAGVKCTDGRVILPNAFKHQDRIKVPLVWSHDHQTPENVLGHAILENRTDEDEAGVYMYAFFNKSERAQHTKSLVQHGDITRMSIWANELMEKSKRVMHGMIREVSLVVSGANPDAVIENVMLAHGDGEFETIDDAAVIHSGIDIDLDPEHAKLPFGIDTSDDEGDTELKHEEDAEATDTEDPSGDDDREEVMAHAQEIYDSMDTNQQALLHEMIEDAAETGGDLKHAELDADASVGDVMSTFTQPQLDVVAYLVHQAATTTNESTDEMKQSDTPDTEEGTNTMGNVFEKDADNAEGKTLSHSDIQSIFAEAQKGNGGSLKEAAASYALQHNITNIEVLFPDARAIDNVPEFLARRNEWVADLLGGTRKTPFSRVKTLWADITMDEARAKGYITGSMKKEEFFPVAKRVTTPTTIYKKQKLDRDDMVDITDFDVVAWLKAEMRLMLDEEIARAILVGDGRDISHEDKINEGNIRPIASDHELYTTTVNVNIDDADSDMNEVVDQIIRNRRFFKGSGQPTMYTSEQYIAEFLLVRDGFGRRMYKTLSELATELRVKRIVPVEVLEEYEDIVAVMVNPMDYVVGATAGGEVTMFDDFDIDYNQHKYLIETRMCGALTKLKAALCVRKVAANLVLAVPPEPDFDPATGALTITDTTGVVYKNQADTTLNNAGSPYTVPTGTEWTVTATPDTGYYFGSSEDDEWVFLAD